MAKGRTKRGREIRGFLLRSVSEHPGDLISNAAAEFGVSRQAVARYVGELIDEGTLVASGTTRSRRYALKTLRQRDVSLKLGGLEEDAIWRREIAPLLGELPANVIDMWHYGCTEMINNVIDHSDGTTLAVQLRSNAIATNIVVIDDGTGIFRKITRECNLEDERHAVLELAKGKLTTDPERHTGEGIFFTSRIMDDFAILSGDVYFSHKSEKPEDWIIEVEQPDRGTAVFMGLENGSSRSTKEVFDHFAADPEDHGFAKTVVPVRMLRQGAENLISRSQAKRLLARLDRFSTIILDFEGVDVIGRAFADEIFRVFVRANPGILLVSVNESESVARAIKAARHVGS